MEQLNLVGHQECLQDLAFSQGQDVNGAQCGCVDKSIFMDVLLIDLCVLFFVPHPLKVEGLYEHATSFLVSESFLCSISVNTGFT